MSMRGPTRERYSMHRISLVTTLAAITATAMIARPAAADVHVVTSVPDLAALTKEIGANHVYRFDPSTGALDAVVTDMDEPNGLAFSPDGTRLYVADTSGARGTPRGALSRRRS